VKTQLEPGKNRQKKTFGGNLMKKSVTIFAAIVICLGISINALAQKKTSVPVTSTIGDADIMTGPYNIGSDGNGVYVNNMDSVVSIINTGGDYALDTKTSPVRRIFISFDNPVNPASPQNAAPFSSGWLPAQFQPKCAVISNVYIQNLQLNETKTCDFFAVSINFNGTTYSLRADPQNYPGTERVQWTCTGLNAGGKCNAWEMAPSAVHDGERKIAMQLLKPATRGPWIDQPLGLYYMSFKVTVTQP
jgi:hypothetical protein